MKDSGCNEALNTRRKGNDCKHGSDLSFSSQAWFRSNYRRWQVATEARLKRGCENVFVP